MRDDTTRVDANFFRIRCSNYSNNSLYLIQRQARLHREYKFKEDAVKARLSKEIELFGEYAPQKALYETYQRRSV